MICCLEQARRETVSALLISPHNVDFACLWGIFDELTWKLQLAETCRQARSALSKYEFPVIVCNAKLPDGDWKTMLEYLTGAPTQLIVCSRLADERQWIEVVEAGGYDLIATPFLRQDTVRVIHHAYLQWVIERTAAWQHERLGA